MYNAQYFKTKYTHRLGTNMPPAIPDPQVHMVMKNQIGKMDNKVSYPSQRWVPRDVSFSRKVVPDPCISVATGKFVNKD